MPTAKQELTRARRNTQRATRTLEKVLRSIDWEPAPTEDEGCLLVDFSGEDGLPLSHALAAVRPESERFVFYLCFRGKTPAKHRAAVAEFIARANYGLVIGNFELRFRDGTVRFKTSLDFARQELTEELVQNAIMSAMEVVQVYGAAVVEVMAGKTTVRKALGDDWD